ncbi:MAG: cell division protein FtsL [Alcanivoracaceae bacterium]|nr:cell division protein FtsL [Alcanivoracaceae bacterium]
MKLKSLIFSLFLVVSLLIIIVDYVYLQHKTRNRFVELQTLIEQEHNLNADWGRLQIEHSTLVNSSRIETKAIKQLGMELPENEHILSIKR